MTKIACVIVTYNRKKLMVEALTSVLNQAEAPEYVVVVDNASTDGTKELLHEQFNFDQKRLFYERSSKNLGGSAGFAQGIQIALKTDCDWISISDDDAIFESGYFIAMRTAMKQHPQQEVFSGSVLLPNGQHDAMHRQVITNERTLTVKPMMENDYRKDFLYDIFSFVGVMLSRNIIERIGVPEQSYFIRYDDFEYALRARKYGQFLNVHNALVLHKTNYTRAAIAPWKEYYVMRNRIASLLKYRGQNRYTRWYCRRFLVRKLLAIALIKNRWCQARPLIHAYRQGYFDGLHNQLGRNQKYLPQ
ncbi:glycosyltransferase family 2 protein [Lactiplantibacillus modestisalitolerans]|uniref:Glycosyltransferase family 2 protein n=1 Tax=Lactiplantibacillus modestisalitolerans TaxID=1457219 RepID=A0ABV5WUE7_9LACO|nr:glycosyltransferase family 2 protein [Lactiplantibacillus modestisalitolerans]